MGRLEGGGGAELFEKSHTLSRQNNQVNKSVNTTPNPIILRAERQLHIGDGSPEANSECERKDPALHDDEDDEDEEMSMKLFRAGGGGG